MGVLTNWARPPPLGQPWVLTGLGFRGCLWARVSTGTLQGPQRRGEGSAHQMDEPRACFHKLGSHWRPVRREGQSNWLVPGCEPTKYVPGPVGGRRALLGLPLHPKGFVQLAVVKHGGSWGPLFQAHLLGSVSFRVLLLGGAGLGPALALRVGCRSDPDRLVTVGVHGRCPSPPGSLCAPKEPPPWKGGFLPVNGGGNSLPPRPAGSHEGGLRT